MFSVSEIVHCENFDMYLLMFLPRNDANTELNPVWVRALSHQHLQWRQLTSTDEGRGKPRCQPTQRMEYHVRPLLYLNDVRWRGGDVDSVRYGRGGPC